MLHDPVRSLSALVLVGLLLPACFPPAQPPPPPPLAPGSCARNIDCAGGGVCLVPDGEVTGTCHSALCLSSVDCDVGDSCHEATGVCLAPLDCAADDDCMEGERCLVEGKSARCLAETDLPASEACALVPGAPALVEGASTRVHVAGKSASGQLEPFGSRAFTMEADAGVVENADLFASDLSYTAACAGAPPCVVELRARDNGGALACRASVLVLPAAPEGGVRVVLVDESSGQPLEGERVTLSTTAEGLREQLTDAHGTAVFDAVSLVSVAAVSVLPAEHDWHSVVRPPSADLLIVTRPSVLVDEAAGARGAVNFDQVSTFGDIRMALGGLSLERGLSGRFSLGDVLGDLVQRQMVVEGVTDADGEPIAMPLGLEMHLGETPLQDSFVALSRPGTRLSWALAGRVRLSELGVFLSRAANGGTFGGGLAEMLRFARRFDHGVGPVLSVENALRPEVGAAPEEWPLTVIDEQSLPAAVFPRVTTAVTLPLLPCRPGSSVEPCVRLPSGLVSITALTPFGQVPLGIAHGDDDPSPSDDIDETDGLVDAANGASNPAGTLELTSAPLHGGLAGLPRVLTTMAFDIERAMDDDAPVSLAHTAAPSAGAAEALAAPFLPFAEGTFTQGAESGALSLTSPAAGADVHRFHLESASGAGWHVWLTDEGASVSFSDLLPGDVAPRHASAALQALDLGAVVPGDADIGVAALFAPNGSSLGDLRRHTRGLSSAPCPLSGGAPSGCVTVDE